MKEESIKKNSFYAWVLASRPKTLTGAAVPVLIGLALAFSDMEKTDFEIIPALLCLLFAFVMQIDANFINDYFDFLKGNDNEMRIGPKRACASGWISSKAMLTGIVITTIIACLIGLPLIFYGGTQMIIVGILCLVFCFLYTLKLSYVALGDVLVLVFFGIIPVSITYYIQTDTISLEVFLASISCGLIIDTLLMINNYRDIENDKKAGKITLCVILGAKKSLKAYFLLGVIAQIIGVVYVFYGHHLAFILPLAYLSLHYKAYKDMKEIIKQEELNLILSKTARNIFLYGIFIIVGILT